jgi:DNA protecting protein DprA
MREATMREAGLDERRQVALDELVRREQAMELPMAPSEDVWIEGPTPDRTTLRLAVVGARAATGVQLAFAQRLGRTLAGAGVIVVSGGAEGIDTAALRGALHAGGKTLVVLGSGLDQPHPAGNAGMFREIVAAGGTLVSQFPCDLPPRSGQFLRRNVLLTRLVDAVIAVCAGSQSGTLHCASKALAAGIPVLAVPWSPDTPKSEGSNWLLGRGARALWSEASAEEFVTALRDGTANLAPLLPERRSKPQVSRRQGRLAGIGVIDGAERATPCYRPEALTAGAARPIPAGCDPELVAKLALALRGAGPQGLATEDLARAMATDRGTVAALCLELVLHGWLARAPGGLMTLK